VSPRRPTHPKGCRAAILCPGPSIDLYPGADAYDLVIGVNRAAAMRPCEYLVALDAHTATFFDDAPLLGTPTVICSPGVYGDQCILRAGWPGLRHLDYLDARETVPGKPVRWHQFGLMTALAWAAHLGATCITVYGADWSGTTDADGFSDKRQRRDPGRWRKEQTRWTETTGLLKTLGVTVDRIVPEPCLAEETP